MEINSSIECVVQECKFNDSAAEHCTLDKIIVEKSEKTATTIESTDCGSFEVR